MAGLQSLQIEARPVLEDISVLIPTIGRELLTGCFASIALGERWPAAVVVSDQSASARVAEWLRQLDRLGIRTTHVTSSQTGVAAARNRGLEVVTTRFVAITDDDCEVATDWLRILEARLRQSPDMLVTGSVEPGGEGVVVSTKTSSAEVVYTKPQLRGDVLYPGNMGLSMEIYHLVGPFDERPFLRSAEDNDWSYRALRAGVSIAYVPAVRVTHLDWRDASELESTYRTYARSQGGVYGKHLRHGDLFIALRLLLGLSRSVLRWLAGFVLGDRDRRARGKAFLQELLPGLREGWSQEGRARNREFGRL